MSVISRDSGQGIGTVVGPAYDLMTGIMNRNGKISLYRQARSIISSAKPSNIVDSIVIMHAEWMLILFNTFILLYALLTLSVLYPYG